MDLRLLERTRLKSNNIKDQYKMKKTQKISTVSPNSSPQSLHAKDASDLLDIHIKEAHLKELLL